MCVSFFRSTGGVHHHLNYGSCDLDPCNICGGMLRCMQSYLSARPFRVRIGATLFILFIQQKCVLQVGVLSITLFTVKAYCTARVIPHHYCIASMLIIFKFPFRCITCRTVNSSCSLQLIDSKNGPMRIVFLFL